MSIVADFPAGSAAKPFLMAGDADTYLLAISVKHKNTAKSVGLRSRILCRASRIVWYGFYVD